MLTLRRSLVPSALLAAALLLAACGGDDGNVVGEVSKDESLPTIITTTTTTLADAAGKPCVEAKTTDAEGQPEVVMPEGQPPTELVKEDIEVGDGAEAKLGDTIKVNYVGVACSTGDQFDSSWDRGEPADFPLTEGGLIDGWIQGIPGMKVGGLRRLVIPSSLGYKETGGPVGPNEAMIFYVELVEVTPAGTETTTTAPPADGSTTTAPDAAPDETTTTTDETTTTTGG